MISWPLGKFTYHSKAKSLFYGFLMAVILLLYVEEWRLFRYIKASLIACFFSTLIAFAIIRFVVYINRVLDCSYPWKRNFNKRLVKQLCYGVLLPLCLAVLLAAAYFALYQVNILYTFYFKKYLFLIIMSLLILNGLLFYELQRDQQRQSKVFLSKQSVNTALKMPIESADIALVKLKDKHYFIVDFKGEELFWQHSLNKTIGMLPADLFYQVNRNYIVNRKAIVKVIKQQQNLQIELLEILNTPDILISRREKVSFKQWL